MDTFATLQAEIALAKIIERYRVWREMCHKMNLDYADVFESQAWVYQSPYWTKKSIDGKYRILITPTKVTIVKRKNYSDD